MGMTQGNIDELAPPVDQAKRDACLHELGDLYAAGAMSMEELDTRVCAAMVAETEDELAELVNDLVVPQPQARAKAPSAPQREAAASTARDEPEPTPATRQPAAPTGRSPRGLVRPAALVAAGTAIAVAAAVVLDSALPIVGGRGSAVAETADRPAAPAPVEAPPSQDLALIPRGSVPVQRGADKVHPVIVPIDGEITDDADVPAQKLIVPSVRELPTAERLALGAGQDQVAEDADRCVLPTQAGPPAEESITEEAVEPIRPLFERVTDRGWLRQHVRRGQAASRTRNS